MSSDRMSRSNLDQDSIGAYSTVSAPSVENQYPPAVSYLAYAKSRYLTFRPSLQPENEVEVVRKLLGQLALKDVSKTQDRSKNLPERTSSSDELDTKFIEFELSDFTVYLPENRNHPWEMRGLNHLATRVCHSSFLFDGILSAGSVRHYVQGVPFKICSIGNYGKETHDVGTDVWIQSDLNLKSEIFYRLRSPSLEYARFHDGFMWLANLAKHFVDYAQDSGDSVSVWDFRSKFFEWINETHSGSKAFHDWYEKFRNQDFRVAVGRNISFIYKEAMGVNERFGSLQIWRELLDLDAVPHQETREEMTVVTPYVYECFKETRFGSLLKIIDYSPVAKDRLQVEGEPLELTGSNDHHHASSNKPPDNVTPVGFRSAVRNSEMEAHYTSDINTKRRTLITTIKCGNVLSVTKDGKGSVWKDEVSRWKAADKCWYIYVQRVHISKKGKHSFDAIWLYKPSDTSCAKMKYPYPNELFLSDNCTCLRSRVEEDEVLDMVDVNWHASSPSQGFFIRQTYLENERFFIRQTYLENERFVTLKDEHKICQHLRKVTKFTDLKLRYPIGQTVLAPPCHKKKHALEAYEVVEYACSTLPNTPQFVVLRHLERRAAIDGKGRPNELVYTTKTDSFDFSDIDGKCLVRFYTEADLISGGVPAPYCRDGTGNAFYITSRLMEVGKGVILEPIHVNIPPSLIQGFDPMALPCRQKLRGLDLYCGGGNFGRGLEEGGAIHSEWAVDIDKSAIHTYYANLKRPTDTKLFFGSVNDMLTEAMQGNPKGSELIPLPGDVDFISAGHPCQGFSLKNINKQNAKGLRDQSLVASVAAYIDFYRPKFGLLENVMGMAQKGKGRDEDILSQLICAIVGMGYQLQVLLLDAWSFGSPQSRTRLFVSFTAPGLEPPPHPSLSHAHPTKMMSRSLGKLANGEAFGHRIICPTPFGFPSAGSRTADLPLIGDGATQHCTSHPDHVVVGGQSQQLRDQITHIPKYPRGLTLSKAWNGGGGPLSTKDRTKYWGHLLYNLKGQLREPYRPQSKAFGRIDPAHYFRTILVYASVHDARGGYGIHWDEDRLLTIMEAKRAQSYPDEEILVGLKSECWKILANSVARTVSLALGLSLREGWLNSLPEALFPSETSGMNIFSDEASVEGLRKQDHSTTVISDEADCGKTMLKSRPDLVREDRNISNSTRMLEVEPKDCTKPRQRSVGLYKARRSQPPPRKGYVSGSELVTADTTNLARSKNTIILTHEHISLELGKAKESSRTNRPTLRSTSSTSSRVEIAKGLEPTGLESSEIITGADCRNQQTPPQTIQDDSVATDLHILSNDEKEITESIFHQFMVSYAPQTPPVPQKISPSQSDSPLKRSSPITQVGRTRLPDKRRKLMPPDLAPGKIDVIQRTENLVVLANRDTEASRRRIGDKSSQKRNCFQHMSVRKAHNLNGGSCDSLNQDLRVHDSTSSESTYPAPPLISLQQLRRIEARTIHTSSTGMCKSSSKSELGSRPKKTAPPIIIDLTSDDEDSSPGHNSHMSLDNVMTLPTDEVNNNKPRHQELRTSDERANKRLQPQETSRDTNIDKLAYQRHNQRRVITHKIRENCNWDVTRTILPQTHGTMHQQQPRQPVKQYVPVDNSIFAPYEQTYRYLCNNRRRR